MTNTTTNENTGRIGQLPPSVVNKIAAGEVIERPASVVKELMENAVDAGATRVEVVLENGGLERIRVSDNGCGMGLEDLPLAVASHATSKIRDADDLFAVATLGFRGEALASIAEVSQMTMRTRVADATMGYEMVVYGGERREPAPCAAAVGTTLDIRNLFFNTPVRRKFMRGTSTELAHATEAFQRIALAFTHIHFSLKHNERVLYELPPVDNWRERIAGMFGQELAESLIAVESQVEGIYLAGFVANPTQSRSNNKMQYLFLNGRHIRDRSLQHALGEAYRGLLLTGRFPISFLRLVMPPDQIDVNVHPTKLEVRFQDSGRVYSHLLGTIRGRFLSTDLTARVQPLEATATDVGEALSAAFTAEQMTRKQQEVGQWARTGIVPAAGPGSGAGSGDGGTSQPRLRWDGGVDEFMPFPPLPHARPDLLAGGAGVAGVDPARSRAGGMETPSGTGNAVAPSTEASWASRAVGVLAGQPVEAGEWQPRCVAFQAHNKYLVAPCDEGLVVIDQHALHERILYEQLREKTLAKSVEVQRMLVPEPVDLPASEASAVLENQHLLAEMGIQVEPFGGGTVLLQGYPAILGDVSPAELLRQVAAQLGAGERPLQRRDILDELLHMMSCKAAIKTGDRLSPREIEALLSHRHLVQDSHHCPHGRPTTLVFTKEELDKRFKRI